MRFIPVLSLLLAAALPLYACGNDDDTQGGGPVGGGCELTDASCFGPQGPTGPGAACLAKTDNSGKTKWTGRFSQITISSPPALATPYIQSNVIDKGIYLDLPACNAQGQGTFSWFFELDTEAKLLKTGGGLPVTDVTKPGCFVSLPNAAIPTAPVTLDVSLDNGTFTAEKFSIVVPIFLAPDKLDTPVLLPIHGGQVQATISSDGNCIGKYNADELEPEFDCAPDTPNGQRAWKDAGVLRGFITVDEADTVFIEDLKTSLCALLAGAGKWKGEDGRCVTSENWQKGLRPEGNWCASVPADSGEPGSPATAECKNAWRLEASFAASAFPITGDCP